MREDFRFTFDGREYELNFTRDYPKIDKFMGNEPITGEPIFERGFSTKPYTTVRILEVDGSVPRAKWLTYRMATAGCWHRDNHHKERGRVHALHLVMKTIPRGMWGPIWDTYNRRHRVPSLADQIASAEAKLAALKRKQDGEYER